MGFFKVSSTEVKHDRNNVVLNLVKFISLIFILGSAAVTVNSALVLADHGHTDALKPMWVGGVYVPVGFDDNDEVVVALDGLLPDSCHVLQQPVVTRSELVFRIELTAKVQSGPCMITSTLPFGKVVSLGHLEKGTYTIEVNDGLTSEELVVEAAPEITRDNYLYAEVSGAHVETDDQTHEEMIDLHLQFSYSCLTIDEIRVIDTGKVVVVLPILKKSEDACEAVDQQRSVQVKLPDTVTVGRHLLHVRSANGNSVNAMFNRW